MIDSVRIKLVCTAKNPYKWTDADKVEHNGASFGFAAVHGATYDASGKFESYKQTCEENKVFGTYTPSAIVQLNISNPTAAAFYEVGKEYYFDSTLAPSIEHDVTLRQQAKDRAEAEAAAVNAVSENLKCDPKGASDYCYHCGRDMCMGGGNKLCPSKSRRAL